MEVGEQTHRENAAPSCTLHAVELPGTSPRLISLLRNGCANWGGGGGVDSSKEAVHVLLCRSHCCGLLLLLFLVCWHSIHKAGLANGGTQAVPVLATRVHSPAAGQYVGVCVRVKGLWCRAILFITNRARSMYICPQ
jgi:hypothetical protein